MHARTLSRLTIAVAVVTLGSTLGCGRDTARRLIGSAAQDDSLVALRAEVELLRATSAERDTLLEQVRETQGFIDSLDTDLAHLAHPGDASVPRMPNESADTTLSMREVMRRRLQLVADRLERSETEARDRAKRIRVLAGENASLTARVAELDSSVARFREIVQGQQEQIASLMARVDTLERANAQLTAERVVLTDSVTHLVAKADSVFVIAASRQELLRLGVVVEEGGTKLPLIGRLNTVIVPARTPRERLFAVLDRRRDVVIPLPNPNRPYRIVSSHDPALLEPSQPGNPIIRGTSVRIADPERFWASSKFLVLVEE